MYLLRYGALEPMTEIRRRARRKEEEGGKKGERSGWKRRSTAHAKSRESEALVIVEIGGGFFILFYNSQTWRAAAAGPEGSVRRQQHSLAHLHIIWRKQLRVLLVFVFFFVVSKKNVSGIVRENLAFNKGVSVECALLSCLVILHQQSTTSTNFDKRKEDNVSCPVADSLHRPVR